MEESKPSLKRKFKEKNSVLANPTLMSWLTIIGLILGIWSIYLSFSFNKEARPVYKIISDVVITSDQFDSKIKVFYDTVQVQNVRAMTIVLWNAGNEFLSKDAFSKDKPINIICSKPINILNLEVLAVSRPELKFLATYYTDDIIGTPPDTTSTSTDYVSLEIQGDEGLEASDGATFSVLYTTKAKDCKWIVDARIKGIPDGFIKSIGAKFIIDSYIYLVAFILCGFVLYRALYRKDIYDINKVNWQRLILIFFVLCMVSFILFAIFDSYPHSTEPPINLLP